MNHLDCAVIGGGPAGLFAALSAAERARELGKTIQVTVFERNSHAGRKLLVTGAGQCNITREESASQLIDHYGDHGRFLRHALYTFPPSLIMQRFEFMGLPLVTREDRKVFPASFRASHVLHTLLDRCRSLGVQFSYDSRITKIMRASDHLILLSGDTEVSTSRTVILATGGKSYPKTGSTGDGYTLLSELGHTVVPPRAALCGISLHECSLGSCSGISLDSVAISFADDSGRKRSACAPMLITHTGLSGPVILNSARYLSEGTELNLCWLPREDGRARTPAEIEQMLKELCSTNGSANLSTIVHRLNIPSRLAQWFLQQAKVDATLRAAEAGKRLLAPLSRIMGSQRFTVSLKGAFLQAMVTAGGVALSEIDPKSMASQIAQGVYVSGEVLDIDGDTGGYNLQAAWSTGALAGMSAVTELLRR